jgi:hypothetical protein
MSKTLKIILGVLGGLAFLLWAGFIIWVLTSHGATGMLRVNGLVRYVFIFDIALGLIFTGLSLWFWLLNRRGKQRKGLFTTVLLMSLAFIVLYCFSFVQMGVFPPSKDIRPITQLPLPGGDGVNLHIAIGSDSHVGAGTNDLAATEKMLEQIRSTANGYQMFLFLGDMVEYGFNDSQWDNALKAFAATADIIPVRLAPGNHDTLIRGLSRYLVYAAPNAKDLWQRIDIGRVHFLMLQIEWSAETYTKEQADWLETQLKSIPDGDWKIVVSHGFYYASGLRLWGWDWYDNPETIDALCPLFEKYGVDLVFSGHKHALEMLEKSGVTYIVCGSFGGHPDPDPVYDSPYSVERFPDKAAFAELIINGDEATVNLRDPQNDIIKGITIEN